MLAIRLFEATNSTMMDSGALEAGSSTLVETYRNWVWRHTTRRMRSVGGAVLPGSAVLCCAQRRLRSGASWSQRNAGSMSGVDGAVRSRGDRQSVIIHTASRVARRGRCYCNCAVRCATVLPC